MFGLASSASVFRSIADMLLVIYKAAGFTSILKWVNDCFVNHSHNQTCTEQEFLDLTGYYGVSWNTKKMRPLAAIQWYNAFDWNLESHTVALPPETLLKSLSLLEAWLAPSGTLSVWDATSLHRKLVHISCIFPLIRHFLHGIACFVHIFKSPLTKIPIFPPLQANLSWMNFIIRSVSNKIPLASPEPIGLQWWGDASMSFGIGVIIGSHWAVWKWAPGFIVGLYQSYDIG